MDEIKFKIITPEKLVVEENVDQVTIPTKSGEITVLKNHLPLVSAIQPGEIILKKGADLIPLAVSGGFVEIFDNQITILADTAERVEEIDLARAEDARRQAETLLKEKQIDTADYTALQAKLEKELARLKVARKHRRSKHSEPKIEN